MLDVFRATLKDQRAQIKSFLKVHHGKDMCRRRGAGGEDILPRSSFSDSENELAKEHFTSTRESQSESRVRQKFYRQKRTYRDVPNYVSK